MFLCDRTMFCLANGPLPLMSCMYYKFDVIYTYGFYGNNTWPVPTFVFLIHWSLLLRQTSCSQIGAISWHTPWQNINLFVKSVRTVCNYRFCWQYRSLSTVRRGCTQTVNCSRSRFFFVQSATTLSEALCKTKSSWKDDRSD